MSDGNGKCYCGWHTYWIGPQCSENAPQPEMFDRLGEPKTYVRREAHDTERAAAELAKLRAGTDKERLYRLLQRGPATTDALSYVMPAYGRPDRPNMYASRILDLVEKGLVEDSGERLPTRTGSPAIVWRVT